MTGPDHIDEIVSAYLDGEATPDEMARVEADPALQARLESLRVAAAAVGSAVPAPSATTRETAVAAALAATMPAADQVADDPDADPAAPLADFSAGRRRTRRATTWAAAAVVALLAAVGGLALSNRPEDSTSTVAAPPPGTTAESRAAAAGAGVADRSFTAPFAAPDSAANADAVTALLGEYPDQAALADAVRAYIGLQSGAQDGAAPEAPAVAPADDILAGAAENDAAAATAADSPLATTVGGGCPPSAGGPTLSSGQAVLDGAPVTWEVVEAEGVQELVVTDASCTEVDRREL
ncbi:MAG: anti-sigma factor family protein [Acidimicrobiia bacterium]